MGNGPSKNLAGLAQFCPACLNFVGVVCITHVLKLVGFYDWLAAKEDYEEVWPDDTEPQ